jgi:SAM-dependent methyltransferase
MSILVVNPHNGEPLTRAGEYLEDATGHRFPILNGIPRICAVDNYADNFGKQWNAFRETQIDRRRGGLTLSEDRFFAATAWPRGGMSGEDILEVGSGAGRFSRVVLEHTQASLWSADYSTAVEANQVNNASIAPDRFHLFQASIYELPFPDGSFDKVFCMGVLQHTPDFAESVRALIAKAKPGGEIVVDFYPVRGWWTRLHAKYLLRPFTRRMSHARLLKLIEGNAGRLITASRVLDRFGLHVLTRFLPVCDIRGTMPPGLTGEELREWVVLDTFDMFSPEYDNPQRVASVAHMFESAGADVTFAGFVQMGNTRSAVVRGVKRTSPDTRDRHRRAADAGEPSPGGRENDSRIHEDFDG